MNGQFLTNVTTDAEGSFSILYPVPLDMDLGTQTVEVRFGGAPLYLPSTSSASFEVFAPTVLTVDAIDTAAVGDEVLITGVLRDNLPDGWIRSFRYFNMDNSIIGTATTESDGSWNLSWVVGQAVLYWRSSHIRLCGATWLSRGDANTSIAIKHNAIFMSQSR